MTALSRLTQPAPASPATATTPTHLAPCLVTPALPLTEKIGRGQGWSPAELQVLMDRYPQGGTGACLPFLPARSDAQIRARARKLGLSFNEGYHQWHPSTDQLDAAIRRLYAGGRLKPGAMLAFCRTWGRSRQWVRSRAIQLRVVGSTGTSRRWTEEEEAILARLEGRGTRAMQRALIAAGYRDRTEPAIAERCRTRDLAVRDQGDEYSATSAAAALGIEVHQVLNWIKRGQLKAAAQRTPGGEVGIYRIAHADLREFLITYPLDWHPGRCDRAWLVEILAGRVGAKRH